VIGVWDDHDYGLNDAGTEMPFKQRNRELWLDFINEPADSDRRLQSDTPIHQDYFVQKGDLKVHIILLDNRYDYDKYGTGDRLGESQWAWLDETLANGKDVNLTLIGAGIQILPDRVSKLPVEQFKTANKLKLLSLLKKHQMSNVVLLSGDVHLAQFYA
jgi:alkaline phosphatase D